MVNGDEPLFEEEARYLLCQSPDEFRKIYGTHFIKGEVKGASIDMRVTVTCSSSQTASSMAGSFSASYSGWGASASASASFEKGLSESSSVSN